MSKGIYKAVFVFSHEPESEFDKTFLKELFMRFRNMVVKEFNGKFEKWNNEFDKLYPDLDGYSEEYEEFICAKQNLVLNKFNKEHKIFNRMLVLKSDPEHECDIYGYSESFETEIELFFEEV